MIVRCIKNNVLDVERTENIEYIFGDSEGQLNLKISKNYNVHAIVFEKELPWFYLYVDDENKNYNYDDTPNVYPSSLFEIVDGSIPNFWEFSMEGMGTFKGLMLGYKEWVTNNRFYYDAVEGSEAYLDIMYKYRKRIIEKIVSH